VLDWKLI